MDRKMRLLKQQYSKMEKERKLALSLVAQLQTQLDTNLMESNIVINQLRAQINSNTLQYNANIRKLCDDVNSNPYYNLRLTLL